MPSPIGFARMLVTFWAILAGLEASQTNPEASQPFVMLPPF
jgi:hypothetical protein